MSRPRYLGMRAGDLDGRPYAKHWNPRMVPLSEVAREAVANGPLAPPLALPLSHAARLLEPGEHAMENGFSIADDGEMHVAIRTEMPRVSPAMVDWWFAWHSDEPERYKLWHPRAHVHAEWRGPAPAGAPKDARARYEGRTSCVDEYLGSELGSYAIQFMSPKELGIEGPAIADAAEGTAVCARVGFADYPIDFGYLIHHVRRVPGGAEMRSRFWVGGPHAGARMGSLVGAVATEVAKRFKKPRLQDGEALLVHCAQEMGHLAGFLPALHGELGRT